MPFDSVSKVIARVGVWLFFVGVCVAFWWVLLERYGFYAIGVFLLGGAIWILLMMWLEFRDRRENGTPGVCRYCGCTDDRACNGGCSWLDETHTSCDAPLCQMRKAAGQ